ncbi:VOC family protein [Ekhidna sp. MALMAid0563]|uniref:VOC family protein n=1 Tax=Ekhidna sp. MALMAid0563 TaxID=3143937 RepID=UPI0032DFBF78
MKKAISIVLFALTILSCSDYKNENGNPNEIKNLQAEKDSLIKIITQNKSVMENQMIRSLTFQDGNAENAMNFYVELFENSKIISVSRWENGAPVAEGKIMQATFELNENLFMCSDSPPVHDWDFSPAVSNYINCENEDEMNRLFSKLSENGKVTMQLANYGFSQKFGWVIDQFGISWQLNLK